MIIDEISLVGREAFGHLDLALKAIIQISFPVGRVSLLFLGYFLQLPLVHQKGLLM